MRRVHGSYARPQEVHGDAQRGRVQPLYRVWYSFVERCTNPFNKNYRLYGGCGVTVCSEWANSYVKFREWALSSGYQRGLWMDRRDNSKGYSPDNCRWVTPQVSVENRRATKLNRVAVAGMKFLAARGISSPVLAKEYGVARQSVDDILRGKRWAHVSVPDALELFS